MLTEPRPIPAPSSDLRPIALDPVGTVRRTNAAWFEAELDRAVDLTTGDLTLDLHGVEFMDGSGIRTLCECAERLWKACRRLVLAAPAYIVEQAMAVRLPAGHVKIYRS